MKISETIKKLEKILKKEGDLNVEIYEYESSATVPLKNIQVAQKISYKDYSNKNKETGFGVILHYIS